MHTKTRVERGNTSLIDRKESIAHTREMARGDDDEGSHGSLEEGALKSSQVLSYNG